MLGDNGLKRVLGLGFQLFQVCRVEVSALIVEAFRRGNSDLSIVGAYQVAGNAQNVVPRPGIVELLVFRPNRGMLDGYPDLHPFFIFGCRIHFFESLKSER